MASTSRNNRKAMRKEAQAAANNSKMQLVVVHDPIGQAEQNGDYGYCPTGAVKYLFPHGEITETINPESTDETN